MSVVPHALALQATLISDEHIDATCHVMCTAVAWTVDLLNVGVFGCVRMARMQPLIENTGNGNLAVVVEAVNDYCLGNSGAASVGIAAVIWLPHTDAAGG